MTRLQLLVCFLAMKLAGAYHGSSPPPREKRLTLDTISPNLRRMSYAVRGEVVTKADEINQELHADEHDRNNHAWSSAPQHHTVYPFDHIVYTNIGNPQSVGQKPLTWPRQVGALVELPDDVGINHPLVSSMFPSDAVRRAKEIKEGLTSGSGAYTHSQGARCFRSDIAKFIEQRDGGVPSNPDNIFMTNGASSAIDMVMQELIHDPSCGVMIPIPQYPIYSATVELLGGRQVGYYLDESHVWDLKMEELERSLKEAKKQGTNVVGFVLINPGNPTGEVLSRETLHKIVQFCVKHKLVLLSDEVYQENVYEGEFVSAKRAASEIGLLDNLELFSFHSTSKGVCGECGKRGGYMELSGVDEDVKNQLYKLASSKLCSSIGGQIMTGLMARGPAPGDESYESHEREKQAIFHGLKTRARLVSDGLDAIPGFSCQPAQGAMYCFPKVEIPLGAQVAAKAQGISPDSLYSLSLLEKTGICVVPASGFGEEKGRFGFRTTFLPPTEEMDCAIEAIRKHHEEFVQQYS